MKHEVIRWLLEGDISIQYQTQRDLIGKDDPGLQHRISREGWGRKFLDAGNQDGSWGTGFYQPKWTSTHYTLLDLKLLALFPGTPGILPIIQDAACTMKGKDGGINPAKTVAQSDVCINGMFLSYACWFGLAQEHLLSVIDFIIGQQMGDGGFNCMKNRSGAVHSSLHSTISVLEGIHAYITGGYLYRSDELERICGQGVEFMLKHRLFKSDRTGEVIHREMLSLRYPYRWRYSTLRALDFLQRSQVSRDYRMQDALDMLIAKRRADWRWALQFPHPGQVHFTMERPGKPSRWITLASLRILAYYGEN